MGGGGSGGRQSGVRVRAAWFDLGKLKSGRIFLLVATALWLHDALVL